MTARLPRNAKSKKLYQNAKRNGQPSGCTRMTLGKSGSGREGDSPRRSCKAIFLGLVRFLRERHFLDDQVAGLVAHHKSDPIFLGEHSGRSECEFERADFLANIEIF